MRSTEIAQNDVRIDFAMLIPNIHLEDDLNQHDEGRILRNAKAIALRRERESEEFRKNCQTVFSACYSTRCEIFFQVQHKIF